MGQQTVNWNLKGADETAQKFAHAKSESNLHQRLHQYEQVHQACEHAMALYDQLDILLHLLRETLQLCSSQGKRRTVEGVRAELTSLLDMIEEIDCTAIIKTLQPIKLTFRTPLGWRSTYFPRSILSAHSTPQQWYVGVT